MTTATITSTNFDSISDYCEVLRSSLADDATRIFACLGDICDRHVKSFDKALGTKRNGNGFVLTGVRNRRTVEIHQSVTIDTNARGQLRIRYPMHIYVDGKLTSEADYKLLFG